MRRIVCVAVLCSVIATAGAAERPKPLVSGLKNPTSVAAGADGRVFLAVAGEVQLLKDGKAIPFATGLSAPQGLAVFQQWLFAADKDRVWRIDHNGKASVLAGPKAFPAPPHDLLSIAVDENGVLYVSDANRGKGHPGAIYRIDPRGKVSLVATSQAPGALLMDSTSHLLVLDSAPGGLYRVAVAGGKAEKVTDEGDSGGLARDWFGRLYFTRFSKGEVYAIPRPGEKAVLLARGFQTPTGLCYDPAGKRLLVVDHKAGTLTALSATIPNWEVDERPMPLATDVAFPDLKWTGWKPTTDAGTPNALRPLVLTHAGDGSNRVFVATQHGVIHVFANDQKTTNTKVFFDMQAKVYYNDNENEQGFLGLAFHPHYRKTGEFFVFYTDKKRKNENVLARFRVSKDDPDRADPASGEELLRLARPFWNHDGGTLCFGPDGYLYVVLGDGGSANDPFDNGQNLKTLLGKVLRLDVNRKDRGKPYAIPRDNPFVDRAGARPEIWAYGLRNVWRMSFDRKTGKLWAADVGQNLWEEIDILRAGGNYGWNRREGLHPFGVRGAGPRKEFIDPIWEYSHDLGKSITGGHVYRGDHLKELQGYYVYADYVTSKIWAMRYDAKKGRVVANRPIRDPSLPVYSFGEDEKGEVYFLTATQTGKGIYRFVAAAAR